MKKRIVVMLAAMSVFAIAAAAQDTKSTAGSKDGGQAGSEVSAKIVTIAGRVSSDGKTLVAKAGGTVWKVLNPDALADVAGGRVVVRGSADAAKHEIEVTTMRLDTAVAARLQDAAFRR